ncbi:MAG: arylamine N-acetyltransferase [Alphaproteobacteria bacterium]|nr:arylamine N-acetyltransferase [Alphaproteobacteria bacterium]MDE2011709.1 arylamine N-acetyltransferase [Alphaproteobacteria bacterium]MDE2074321.1 arylamine N-acetyltransferase [Alphaproteobacteria bacterium]MDE2353124.1 arylamine N-acetyltransferase [Alphaproteobacteria bacterium]
MDIDSYLERIGLKKRPEADLAGLTALHRAHLHAISYENLDVQLGRPVTLALGPIFEKLVTKRRGGWCYEMNGLFGWALGELGFRVTRATGAVMRQVRGEDVVGNHLVLRVELEEGLYLADAGFGDGPLDPIAIRPGAFTANGFEFSLSQVEDGWWRLHNHPAGGAPSFDFRLDPADEAVLGQQCQRLQTAADSPFVQNAVCQRYTAQGLFVLRGRVLRIITPDRVSERRIDSVEDYLETLHAQFALDVPEAASLWPAICARHDALFAAVSRSPG